MCDRPLVVFAYGLVDLWYALLRFVACGCYFYLRCWFLFSVVVLRLACDGLMVVLLLSSVGLVGFALVVWLCLVAAVGCVLL